MELSLVRPPFEHTSQWRHQFMERGAFKKEVALFLGCCCPVSSVSGVRLVCWIWSAWPRRARPLCWVPHPWRGLEQPPTLCPCAVFGVSPVWWSVPWTLLTTPRVWEVSLCIVLPPVIPVSPGFTKSYSHYLASCDIGTRTQCVPMHLQLFGVAEWISPVTGVKRNSSRIDPSE